MGRTSLTRGVCPRRFIGAACVPQALEAVNRRPAPLTTGRPAPSLPRVEARMERQSHIEVVHAPLTVCFDTIVDFEFYPDWFSGITTATIREHDVKSSTWTVEYTLNMMIKTISYTLAYQGDRPGSLTWKRLRGDIKDIEGSYKFVELEPGVTEATCTQGVDVGFWIPGPLRRTFERTALVDSVREFKRAAEARAAVHRGA
jgi:hypothetical protein